MEEVGGWRSETDRPPQRSQAGRLGNFMVVYGDHCGEKMNCSMIATPSTWPLIPGWVQLVLFPDDTFSVIK